MERVLLENKVHFTNLVICSLYWLLSWRAVNLQMNRTVKYQRALSRIVGLRAIASSSPLPFPLQFFLLPLLLSPNNSIGNACYPRLTTRVFTVIIESNNFKLSRFPRPWEQPKTFQIKLKIAWDGINCLARGAWNLWVRCRTEKTRAQFFFAHMLLARSARVIPQLPSTCTNKCLAEHHQIV